MAQIAAFMLVYMWSLASAASVPGAADRQKRAIYGDDNRFEEADASTFWRNVARSTVMLTFENRIIDEPCRQRWNNAVCDTQTLPTCSNGQRFGDQPTCGFCSGTLIGPDLVAAAGHCVDRTSGGIPCDEMRIIFNVTTTSMAEQQVLGIPPETMFRCNGVVHLVNEGDQDWAVIRLDRPVEGSVARPAAVGTAPLTAGTGLMLIGHPSALPRKYADDATVLEVIGGGTAELRCRTNLDAFHGNSGSGVFTTGSACQTAESEVDGSCYPAGVMVGMLTYGRQDYNNVTEDDPGCLRTYSQSHGREIASGVLNLLPWATTTHTPQMTSPPTMLPTELPSGIPEATDQAPSLTCRTGRDGVPAWTTTAGEPTGYFWAPDGRSCTGPGVAFIETREDCWRAARHLHSGNGVGGRMQYLLGPNFTYAFASGEHASTSETLVQAHLQWMILLSIHTGSEGPLPFGCWAFMDTVVFIDNVDWTDPLPNRNADRASSGNCDGAAVGPCVANRRILCSEPLPHPCTAHACSRRCLCSPLSSRAVPFTRTAKAFAVRTACVLFTVQQHHRFSITGNDRYLLPHAACPWTTRAPSSSPTKYPTADPSVSPVESPTTSGPTQCTTVPTRSPASSAPTTVAQEGNCSRHEDCDAGLYCRRAGYFDAEGMRRYSSPRCDRCDQCRLFHDGITQCSPHRCPPPPTTPSPTPQVCSSHTDCGDDVQHPILRQYCRLPTQWVSENTCIGCNQCWSWNGADSGVGTSCIERCGPSLYVLYSDFCGDHDDCEEDTGSRFCNLGWGPMPTSRCYPCDVCETLGQLPQIVTGNFECPEHCSPVTTNAPDTPASGPLPAPPPTQEDPPLGTLPTDESMPTASPSAAITAADCPRNCGQPDDGGGTCREDGRCLSCNANRVLQSGWCYSSIACKGRRIQSGSRTGSNCRCLDDHCHYCNRAAEGDTCRVCRDGFYLLDDACIATCPVGATSLGIGTFKRRCMEPFTCRNGRIMASDVGFGCKCATDEMAASSCQICEFRADEHGQHCSRCLGDKFLHEHRCVDDCDGTGLIAYTPGNYGRECRPPFTCTDRVDEVGNDCKCARSVGRNDCLVCNYGISGATCARCTNSMHLHRGACIEACPNNATAVGSDRDGRECQ